ncbi:hypothetical protein [Mycoplasmopsis columboralis]|uniref:Uncharacterized protein n=1 Tax=Mycoplasmopsis columboralis TaxID=171282 RepID=A0A449B6N1_9BACT|nr:hypothetical protein [Mycoplasmopsis columboralis]VEU76263.1 Uncharacterised protein [Mycoplasmopsis columboralis]
MTYTYKEIKNNTDFILIQTVDVVSLYNAFRKILLKANLSDDQLRHALTFSTFQRNDSFVKDTKIFAVALGYLSAIKAQANNDKFAKIKEILKANNINKFEDVLPSKDLQDQLYLLAQDLFSFLRLDGSAKNLITLVEELNIFTPQEITEVEKTTLFLHPVNGCDLPS